MKDYGTALLLLFGLYFGGVAGHFVLYWLTRRRRKFLGLLAAAGILYGAVL